MSFTRFEAYSRQQTELSQHRHKLSLPVAEAPRFLPDERLALLLARLQVEAEPVRAEADGVHLQPLIEAVSAFIARHAGAAGFSLAPAQAELLAILDDLFARLATPDELALGLHPAVAPLRLVLARLALSGSDLFADVSQPGRALLEFVVRAGRGWDQHAGRRAEELPVRIEAVARRLATQAQLGGPDCEQAVAELAGFLQEFGATARANEQRLIAQERGQVRQQDARLYVAERLGATLAGRALPEILLMFLAEIWSKYLHTVFLRDGLDSEPWRVAVAEIEALVAVSEGGAGEAERREYASMAFTALGRVREAVDSIHHNLEISAGFFEAYEGLVLARLEGREHGLALAEALPAATELAPAPLAEGDRDALRRARSLRPGDWLVLTENGVPVRCKVADKDIAHGYLLFTNYSGVRVAKREFAVLAEELAAGTAWPLARASVFETALPTIEAGCEARLSAAKRRLIEALRARELERARQMAEELADQERQQAEARARAAAEAEAKAAAQACERAYQESLAEVRQLQPGGWVELPEAGDKRAQAKLALIMASTRKLVFVNRQGQRLAELTQEDLARLVAEGQAAIVHFGVAFDQTLQSLIQRRREQLSE